MIRAMEQMLKLTVASPEGIRFEGLVERVTLPGAKGSFTLLPRHAALISSLTAGTLRYLADGQEHEIAISAGFAEVNQDIVSVCIEE
jgi:F-type H+-transporting ATPase subunit epsilon